MENQTITSVNNTPSEIKKEVTQGAIEISRVYKGEYNKADELTAELKQVVTTKSYYPTKQIRNDKQDNIFGLKDFPGGDEKEFVNNEKRVAWLTVPVGETVESVAQKLAAYPKARLYRVLANRPILTSGQKAAIASPDLEVTESTFANRQAVINPETKDLILDKAGKVQYRAVFFSIDGKPDEDLRTSNPSDYWVSEEIAAKMAEMEGNSHVVAEQRI